MAALKDHKDPNSLSTGRLTRSRARSMVASTTRLTRSRVRSMAALWEERHGDPNSRASGTSSVSKRKKTSFGGDNSGDSVTTKKKKDEVEPKTLEDVGGSRQGNSVPGTLASRPLSSQMYPPNPSPASTVRITMRNKASLKKVIPTLRVRVAPYEPCTTGTLANPVDKNMVLHLSRSIVHVSSPLPDGEWISPRTGVIIRWDAVTKRAMVLTTHSTYFKNESHEPQPKLLVHLPNKTVVEGQLIFINLHYNLAILEITSGLSLQVPTFGSAPKYGQEIFALFRDKNISLMARHGAILWEDGSLFWRNHHMYIDCNLPKGADGGLVVDTSGAMIGMISDDCDAASIISISTVLCCVEMWEQFSCVARPVFHMDLTSVALLPLPLRNELSIDYNINDGYIVADIAHDSTLERLGVRRGDVIFLEDEYGSTLPEFEDYLLSLGSGYLHGIDNVVLKMKVYDVAAQYGETITWPVEFTISSNQGNEQGSMASSASI